MVQVQLQGSFRTNLSTHKVIREATKIAKIRYIRYKSKNPLYLKSLKSIFNRLGVFRSVRDLEVRKRMGSSDATCCASMAVNTCFFSP